MGRPHSAERERGDARDPSGDSRGRPGASYIRRNALALRLRLSGPDRKSTRLNSSHLVISYAVFCLKKKKNYTTDTPWSVAQVLYFYHVLTLSASFVSTTLQPTRA